MESSSRIVGPFVALIIVIATAIGLLTPGVPHAQGTSGLGTLPESPPAKQTIYYVGKESTTDFDQPGMGLHLQYFPAFDLQTVESALPTDCDGCLESTPDFENFKHHHTADLADRTFSPDASGVGSPGDPDFEPAGVRTAGGFSDWAVFTLPGDRTGTSGTTRDPAACGGSNNFVNQIRINTDSLQSFCLNLITDNTNALHDPDLRLEVRSDTASFDLAGHDDFSFDGQTDMYTFRYRGMREGDRIKIRIAGSDAGSCRGPGLGGIMVSHISTCTPPPGECVPRCTSTSSCEDDGCGRSCGACPRADKLSHRQGIVDVTVQGAGGPTNYHEEEVDTPVRLAESFASILDGLETQLRQEFNAALVEEVGERGLKVRNFFLALDPDTATVILEPLAAPNEDRFSLVFRLGGVLTHAKYKPDNAIVNTGSLNPSFTVTITAPGIGIAGTYDPVTGAIVGPLDPETGTFAPEPIGIYDEEGLEVDVDPNSDWEGLQFAIDLFDFGGDIGNVLIDAFTDDKDNPFPSTGHLFEQFDSAIREALSEKLGAAAGAELGGLLRPAVELVPEAVEIGGINYAPQILSAIQNPVVGQAITLFFDNRPAPPDLGEYPIVHQDRGRFSLDVFDQYTIETYVRTTTFPDIMGEVEAVYRSETEDYRVEGWVCAEELEASLDVGLFSDGRAIKVVRADLDAVPAVADACTTEGSYRRYRYALSATNAEMGLANVWDNRISLIAGYDRYEKDMGVLPRSSADLFAPDEGPGAVVFAYHRTFIGDFNGDGLADNMGYADGVGWRVALSNGEGFDPPTLWLGHNVQDSNLVYTVTMNDGHTYVDDFDGDGRDDLLWYNNGLYVATSNGAAFGTPSMWRVDTGSPRLHNWPYGFTGDFNGDGMADYMVNFNGWQVALSNGSGFDAPALWLANSEGPGGVTYFDQYQAVADFDGDGKDDWMWRDYYDGDLWVALANAAGTDFEPPSIWLPVADGDPNTPDLDTTSDAGWYVADFDGDDRADYMWHSGGWNVARSNGDRFAPPTIWLETEMLGSDGDFLGRTSNAPHQHVADFDGDGMQDYLFNYLGWHVALSNGERFEAPRLWLANDAIPGVDTHADGREYVADFTGDGQVDLLWNYMGWNLASTLVTPVQYLVGAVDRDGDGVVDVADNCPGKPNPDQADADFDGAGDVCDQVCADGLDNDGDGAIDFPYDRGCASAMALMEDPACDDGVDNDGDGLTDWPEDWSCRSASSQDELTLGCGLGFELAVLLPPLLWARRRGLFRRSG